MSKYTPVNMIKKPLILISNDDGFRAKGIRELARIASEYGYVIVCAPEGARSGNSRAFSMEAIRVRQISKEDNVEVWACSGTPVDCVKLAYAELCPRTPDLVLSGINHGDNASTNAHYSGTVGVVIEGAMKGIASVAFSLCDYAEDADFAPMEHVIRQYIEKALNEGMPHYECWNINCPKVKEIKGVRECRMAHGHWINEVEKCVHPTRGYNYYFMCGSFQNDEPDAEDTDAWALANGYAAVTPLTVDMTNFKR